MAEENKENACKFNSEDDEGRRGLRSRSKRKNNEEKNATSKKQKVSVPCIRLRTSDNKIRVIDLEIMKCSRVIRDLVENLGEDDLEETEIPVQVTSRLLKVIEEWATFHRHDYMEIENDYNPANISEYDGNFLMVSKERLEEIFLTADYLDIKSLTNVISKLIASKIRNKAPCEIYYFFRSWT